MALRSLVGPFPLPSCWAVPRNATYGVFSASAGDERFGYVVRVPRAGVITKVAFVTGTITTGATLAVRVETVGTDGVPTGTLWGANTNVSQAIVAVTDDNKWFTVTLTAGARVDAGDIIAVVVVNPSFPDAGTYDLRYQIQDGAMQNAGFPIGFPYVNLNGTLASGPVFGYLEYDNGKAPPNGLQPFSSVVSSGAFNSGSSPDERGVRFRFPVPIRVSGAWFVADAAFTPGSFDVRLYDSDGVRVLESINFNLTAAGREAPYFALFTKSVILKKNTFYRLTIRPNSVTDQGLIEVTLNSLTEMQTLEGGTDVHLTTRTDGGVWSQTTTRRPLMGLLVDAIDDGARVAFPLE